MQTEFEFHFSAFDFTFEKEHKFTCRIGDKNKPFDMKDGLAGLEFWFRIVPGNRKNETNATQVGSLFLKIPLPTESAKEIVFELLYLVNQQINFNNPGIFNVTTTYYMGERIPQTEEEEKEINGKPHFAEVSMVEYIGEPTFDSSQFAGQVSQSPMDFTLVQQHNHASQTKHPIDRYVSYYKIIEDVFSTKKEVSAKSLLTNNFLLKEIYNSAFDSPRSDEEYLSFISTIVDVRHKCSHLKRGSDFGYRINDERIEVEVEQLLDLVHYITYQLILKKGKNA